MTKSVDVLLADIQTGGSLAYNFPYENLRLGALASGLRRHELSVGHYHSEAGEADFIEHLRSLLPSGVVIFDTLYRVSGDVVELVRTVRDRRPDVSVVLVGRAAASLAKVPIVAEAVDATFDSSDIAGVTDFCSSIASKMVATPRLSWAQTRPERPFRKFSLQRGVLDIEATKGCAHSCSFCAVDGIPGQLRRRDWQPRPVSDVVAEIGSLTAELGISKVQFVDDNLLGGPQAVDWAWQFADEVRSQRLDIRFSCYARLDHVLNRVLEPLTAAGLVQVHAGVESGSRNVLRRLRKGLTPDGMARMVDRVRRAGVQLVASLIVFEPRMTLDELEESLVWVRGNALERFFSLSTLIPFANSLAFDELVDLRVRDPGMPSVGSGFAFVDSDVEAVYSNALRREVPHSERLEALMRTRFRQEELFDLPSPDEEHDLRMLDQCRRAQIGQILADVQEFRQ